MCSKCLFEADVSMEGTGRIVFSISRGFNARADRVDWKNWDIRMMSCGEDALILRVIVTCVWSRDDS